MPIKAHRRLRLPADHRSPGAARAAVREVLTETGLMDLLDEALLLTTELSTNGVIHAGTELEVDVAADGDGLTVTVTDFKGGPIENSILRPADELAEHGRGLLLVDQFATAWGTTHDADGKGVWFRLDLDRAAEAGTRAKRRRGAGTQRPSRRRSARATVRSGTAAETPAEVASGATGGTAGAATGTAGAAAPTDGTHGPPSTTASGTDGTPLSAESLVWLVHVPEDVRLRLALPQLVSELLLRLCEVTGATGGAVWLDRGDGRGEHRLASYGTTDVPGTVTVALSAALPVSHPLSATLTLYADAGTKPSEHWERLARLSAERMAITIEADRLRQDDIRRRSWLTFLAEASELLAQSLDVDLTLALVPQIVVPRLGAWCAIHVVDEWDDLRLAAAVHADESALPGLTRQLGTLAGPDVTTRLREALQTQAPVTLGRPLEGIVVPLAARGNALGTLSVGRPPERLHGADDVAVIEDVCRRASLAIDNSRVHAERKEVAQAFQRGLLPSALPTTSGVEFGSEYVPASTGTDVGGDFYDVFEVRPKQWLVAIGDVCGKGAQAAAMTGLVRDVIRVLVRDGRPLSRALELLNRTLIEQHDEGRYCTLATALMSQKGDDLHADLCLAGHERPMLVHADGRVEPVGVMGTAVGLLDDIDLRIASVTLSPGEALVFFTDGVTERRRGEELYGLPRLRRELGLLSGHPAPVVAARIRAAALAFSGDPPRDDIAILVVRNLG